MIISPFTPLFFARHRTDGIESEYTQTFATTDHILIELVGADDELDGAVVKDAVSGHELYAVQFSLWRVNEAMVLRFASLSFPPGLYTIAIPGIGECRPFRVTDNTTELSTTTLIQYSMKDNRQRDDTVFFIDGMQRFFDFRVPGGFKDRDWTFGVDGEQFVTDSADIVQLYGMEHTEKKFTLGTSSGCPVWFAEMLNRILCCTYVYFDGERYARKDNSVPETIIPLEGYNSFVFTQQLQRVANIDPVLSSYHAARMRRVPSTPLRITTNNNPRIL